MQSDRNQQQKQRAIERVSAAWDSWTRHTWKGQIIRRRTRDDMVPRCRASKTLACHLLLTPMASINILELASQEEAVIAVLCILSPSPDLFCLPSLGWMYPLCGV